MRPRIERALREFEGRFTVTLLPNITHVFYGRDVGYVVEQIELDAAAGRLGDRCPPPTAPTRRVTRERTGDDAA